MTSCHRKSCRLGPQNTNDPANYQRKRGGQQRPEDDRSQRLKLHMGEPLFPVQPAAEIPNQIADREPNIDKQILNQNVCKWRLGAPFDGKLLKRFHSRAPCGHAFSKLMSFIGILLWATTAIPQN